jgi:putative NIF3 family GTP cyclohydrolase 1 type 2
LSKDPDRAFYDMNTELLKKLREKHVSIYNFHFPLDNFSLYSTSKTLADALGITVEKPFAECNTAMCGVIGTTDCKDIYELNDHYSRVVGHETKLYKYGKDTIINGKVGVCAGGGNAPFVINELIENGISVLITGLSVNNMYSSEAHNLEKKHNINLLGGTHYSSEKFACIAMCGYFNKFGLPSEFINDVPCFEDL